jgi:hypothetical protein
LFHIGIERFEEEQENKRRRTQKDTTPHKKNKEERRQEAEERRRWCKIFARTRDELFDLAVFRGSLRRRF